MALFIHKLRNLPISRLVLTSMVLISLLPLLLLGPQIHQAVWEQAQKDITEKHLLLAQNLTEPLTLFVDSHMSTLNLLATTFQQFDISDKQKLDVLLDQSVNKSSNFNTLALLLADGQTLGVSVKNNLNLSKLPDYSTHPCFKNVMRSGKHDLSAVHKSLSTSQPTLVMGQPVFNLNNQLIGVLLAEISLQPIEKIRARVQFGKLGHSAIFDARGNVIAHPNKLWMNEIKNLSALPIIKAMMQGQSGVMNFYSPYHQQEMVAGYATVKDTGWGVMVPQPTAEISAEVTSVLQPLLAWSIIGIIIAITVSIYITRWITSPVNQLAKQARQLDSQLSDNKDCNLDLEKIVNSAPCEIVQMSRAMQKLVDDLRTSNHEINALNNSLQDQIQHATSELRAANHNLEHIASSDHLTTISNRRYFETTVSDILIDKSGKSIGIMLVDIDNFKQINDCFGHAAGDYVLTTVAQLLNRATRPGDIIARYGGDEFVAEFESDPTTIHRRAEDLRKTVEEYPFTWKGITLRITLSIGITCHKTGPDSSLDKLMTEADSAMYQAKKDGRNKVAIVNTDLKSDSVPA